MANHAYVKTRKHMSFEAIDAILHKLNEEVFHGCLEIEPWRDGGPGAWGPDGWVLTIQCDGFEDGRVCWLNSPRSFEIRHGGGGDFIWWVDMVICQAVRDAFGGRWSDDGGAGDIKSEVPKTYHEYMRHRFGRRGWATYRFSLYFDKPYVALKYREAVRGAKKRQKV
ncbi:MAG: hypothetical protein JSS66_07830 [Armatimonadetes bacterium]|nr:hypothetical protein [Armatimonadota bacterium]